MSRFFTRNHNFRWAAVIVALTAITLLLLFAQGTYTASANGVPFSRGDVFAGTGNGKIKHFSPAGDLLDTLDTTSNSREETGMCFSPQGDLYTTNWTDNTMSKFNADGVLVGHPFGVTFNSHPGNCTVDAAGYVYVGETDDQSRIFKFDSNGVQLATFSPQREVRGVDWLDLGADQCTMYYTSEGNAVKRFNVCTGAQLSDFRSGLEGPCYAVRARPNGEVMVACWHQIYRLSFTGTTIRTYQADSYNDSGPLFAQNLDPDGRSFWTAGYSTGHIYRIDIATGGLISHFASSPETLLTGLGVLGEITAAQPTPTPGNGTPAPTACAITFSDVAQDYTFYPSIKCLACRGIVSGYVDGGFRPGSSITRGQIAKVVSSAAGFDEDAGEQVFEDVPQANAFYAWINRLARRGLMSGYPCGGTQLPCVAPSNRPYFAWSADATRGQLAKIVSNGAALTDQPTGQQFADVPPTNSFYPFVARLSSRAAIKGYSCGGTNPASGEAEPCDGQSRPYFRPNLAVTRGQAAKIVANIFLPGCVTP